MSASSIQFRGIKAVVSAYVAMELPGWSLWQGGQMLPFQYNGKDITEGESELNEWLKRMGEGTNAIYTLKVYKKPPQTGIEKNTKDNGMFNFRMNLDDQLITNAQYGRYNNNELMMQEITTLKAKIIELEQQDDDDEEDEEDTIGKITRLMEKPMISKLIGKLFNLDIPAVEQKISGLPQGEELLQKALEILKKNDKFLPDHLWKLAQLSEQQPVVFAAILGKLNEL